MVDQVFKAVRLAVEGVLLGASLQTVHLEHQMHSLGIEDERDWVDALRRLDTDERARIRSEADEFVSEVCRRLGERHSGDTRICRVLEEWVRQHKDYAAFDSLLCHFEFANRAQVLAEAKRLFPSTLTAHW